MDMENEDPQPKAATQPKPSRPWRRAAVATTVLGGMLFSGFSVLPTAVMNSAHRDSMLNERFEKFGITATSQAGSGSWISPATMQNVVFKDETGQVEITIREIRTSRSIFGLLMNGGDLGTITLINPTIRVSLDNDGRLPPKLRGDLDDASDSEEGKLAFALEIVRAALGPTLAGRLIPVEEPGRQQASAAVTL